MIGSLRHPELLIDNTEVGTDIVPGAKHVFKVSVHVVVIHSHEECIYHNAQRDEQFHKRIKYDETNDLLGAYPAPTTIPHTEDIDTFETTCEAFFFPFRFFVFFFLE